MSGRRLGVFGGTFDPPHLGHLRLAEACLRQLGLDVVLWVLTADPPHKQGHGISPVSDRLALVQAAISGHPGFALSRVDLDRPGPHWAADTVRLLAQQNPGAALVYLMGGDSLRDLPTWGRPQEFLAACTLGVVRRPGAEMDLAALEAQLPGVSNKVAYVDLEPVDISAREVRRRVRAGESVAKWVPALVADVIQARRLYRADV